MTAAQIHRLPLSAGHLSRKRGGHVIAPFIKDASRRRDATSSPEDEDDRDKRTRNKEMNDQIEEKKTTTKC